MSDPQNGPPILSATIPRADILSIVSLSARWYLPRGLASCDQFMVSELAERVGQSPGTTSKNMDVLRDADIVTQGRNRLYQIALNSSRIKRKVSWIRNTSFSV